MAKAIASGDERLMQKAGLEADIAGWNGCGAAHEDQYGVHRQVRDAEREIETEIRRIGEIGQERLLPTAGDAFAMLVTAKLYTDRNDAGRALMKEILTLVQLKQQGEVHIASIGGFDLVYEGEKFGRGDNYHYQTLLQRIGANCEIELPVTVTPIGAVARIEYAFDGFEAERERYRQSLKITAAGLHSISHGRVGSWPSLTSPSTSVRSCTRSRKRWPHLRGRMSKWRRMRLDAMIGRLRVCGRLFVFGR